MKRILVCSTLRCAVFGLCLAAAYPVHAGDWPMWRHDAVHSGSTPEKLATELHLQWTLELPSPKPAWPPTQNKLQFDASYEPVVMGQRIFVPSMVRDSVTAYSTRSGNQLWRFYADGPVRFAPLASNGKVYFGSDDGYLYCLQAADGKLLWKLRGGPTGRKILGNGRLISTWPARGAPVLYQGVIYFTAGIWPFMGTFIHAVDAQTGQILWTNSGSGSDYQMQPHGSPAFAGVAPQGYLTATEKILLVPGGRSVPAAYDRKSGDFLYYHINKFYKRAGGYDVAASQEWFTNGGTLFRLSDGSALANIFQAIVSGDTMIGLSGSKLTGYATTLLVQRVTKKDRIGREKVHTKYHFKQLWQSAVPPQIKRIMIRAGSRVYATDQRDGVFAIDLPQESQQPAAVSWQGKIRGYVWTMLAADQRLFTVSREGSIFCFGGQPKNVSLPEQQPGGKTAGPKQQSRADQIVRLTGVKDGYCVVLGLDTGGLAEELAKRTNLQTVVVENDPKKAAAARRRLDQTGMLGQRVAVLPGDLFNSSLPPYMASLIVCEHPRSYGLQRGAQFVQKIFQPLRPYGGVAVLMIPEKDFPAFTSAVRQAKLQGAKLQRQGEFVLLRREGPLPDSAPWTHQNGDVGNTLISPDRLVKAPLGILWFGGPSNRDVLPRHGHGPVPQVVGGRLFIEGQNMLRAVDVYTGRLLWQRDLPEVGLYFENTGHHPGAGAIGSNYVSVQDGIYVAYGRKCLRLSPETGETIRTFVLPADESGDNPYWGYVGVYENLLIAGSSPIVPLREPRFGSEESIYARFAEGSQRLVVLDRHSGKVLWSRQADHNFRHNAITAGGGKVFCIDNMTDARLLHLKRRGKVPKQPFRILALDASSGKIAWQTDQNVFGTWLAYSSGRDVLLQATSRNRDRSKDETGRGMVVYRADTGEVLWQNDDGYGGPCLIRDDTIFTQSWAVNLLTGKRLTRAHPLTGRTLEWTFTRNYGCNTAIGCTNLLTFRSAAAGYFDLQRDSGTGNLGGFRSSCTSNLVPADGVLNAPDYTRTCSCSYQLQTSLALIHMPEAEMWTFQSMKWDGQQVQRVGINFGAPGDRRDDSGMLWMDYPSVGGRSPDLPIAVEGANVRYYRHHASRIQGQGHAWVASSGLRGAEKIRITLAGKNNARPALYTVRLHFAEVDARQAKDRMLNVALQGKPVLQNFNVVSAAGGLNRAVTRKFSAVKVTDELELTFSTAGSSVPGSLLSGIEIVLEKRG